MTNQSSNYIVPKKFKKAKTKKKLLKEKYLLRKKRNKCN